MAYEHGSLDLGLRNPFRFEGTIRAMRGILTTALGVLVLLAVTSAVQQHQVFGWITAITGFLLLSSGLWTLGSGLMQTLRFFVGRSVPTSLAYNNAKSEADSAKAEEADVAYDGAQLEQMLVGRKNLTFTEPQGLIARLIHTLFPKLTFVPYPIRNMAQQLTDTLAQTLVAIVVFGLASFVLSSGLVGGNHASILTPIISTLFLGYLMIIWFKAGKPISRNVANGAQSRGASGLARTLVLAVTLPTAAAMGLSHMLEQRWARNIGNLFQPMEQLDNGELFVAGTVSTIYHNVSNSQWIMAITVLALLTCALITVLIAHRCRHADPITQVSELRENWQESVHPREIFINLDSMVMANRRYKEVPNRIYRSLKPMLKEQSNGKGAFYGETIQETQPRAKPIVIDGLPKAMRITGTVVGQLLMLAAAVVLFSNYETLINLTQWVFEANNLRDKDPYAEAVSLGTQIATMINALIAMAILAMFGRMLTNLTHVFWSEFQFESQLIYFKCEGTYTESTISTGKGIYDSTQSENVICRSSMTPWVVTATAISSTFAGVGSKNLEQPRHLMALHSNDNDMSEIVNDLRGYLKSRQTIANLNTEADIEAAAQIHSINEQSRAMPTQGLAQTQAALGANQQQLEHQE
ncbi:hypothetical protein [Ferrimonas lipolytica]|uniref:Uncharacterized protein n=1 Tax=Ferrimonas lipolytica TaxID=2724191 RepID=A0A6H1UG73_9GAMM|nr:hypothetical protein [Ferrimonas lipolytica]QIZ77629.1 hypothetical protein HER31_12440 [Ferrimonas lipolytica]